MIIWGLYLDLGGSKEASEISHMACLRTESGIKKLIVSCLRHFPGGFGLVSICGNNKKSVASRNNM